MLTKLSLATLVLSAIPCAATAQSWQDAIKKGDYQAAVAILQPLAVKSLLMVNDRDAEALQQLARMYAEGRGVAADPVLACGLAKMFSSTAEMQPPATNTLDEFNARQARLKQIQDAVKTLCAPLSAFDRESADRIACFTFGMPNEVMTLGSEAIRVDRGGIRLASDSPRQSEIPANCPQLIARVRVITIEPPSDALSSVKARYFVEVLAWQAAPSLEAANTLRYLLGWQLFELRGKKLEMAAMQNVTDQDVWPAPALPNDIDARISMEMIRTGHVHWKIDGAPPKRGWAMLPEKQP